MRRYMLIFIALIAISAVAYDYRTTHGQQPGTRRDTTSSARTSTTTEVPKGKLLVEKLPEGLEGVVLEKGVIMTKPGYKFVKKGNRVMVVNSATGGVVSGGGSWNCSCKGKGVCASVVVDNKIDCVRDDCPDGCSLAIIIRGLKTAIIQY